MSHIHIPDGVLPIGWWVIGYLLTGIFLFLAIKKLEKGDLEKKIPYLGVVSAIMLITMSIPLGIIPFHINLTVLMGILAGPALGFISVFIVNLFLSFLGHGGITMVGLNTLILGLEVVCGSLLFRTLHRRVKTVVAIGVVTVITLVISTGVMVGVVGVSQAGWEYALPHSHNYQETHEHDHLTESESIANPSTAEDTMGVGISADSLELDMVDNEVDEESGNHAESLRSLLTEVSFVGFTGLGALLGILIIGIGLEVLVTILLTRFFLKVRPDLIN